MESSTKITIPSGLGFGLMDFWLFLGMSCMADHDHRARVQVASFNGLAKRGEITEKNVQLNDDGTPYCVWYETETRNSVIFFRKLGVGENS